MKSPKFIIFKKKSWDYYYYYYLPSNSVGFSLKIPIKFKRLRKYPGSSKIIYYFQENYFRYSEIKILILSNWREQCENLFWSTDIRKEIEKEYGSLSYYYEII